jgi:hypothetical protein
MFRSVTSRVAAHMSELIDDMLVGDFDYIVDGDEVYADIDYDRLSRECGGRVRPAAPSTPLINRDRRPGTVAPQPAVCTSPMRPLTVAASRRSDAA